MSRSRLTAIQIAPEWVLKGHPVHLIDTHDGIEIPVDDAHEVMLHVSNDGASIATMTIRGGDPSKSSGGHGEAENFQVSPLEIRFFGPIDTSAFAQAGNVIWLDFSPGTVGRISAFRIS